MAIENRNLEVGTRLVANYKKESFTCVVERAEEGEGVLYVLTDGSKFKSPSSAGMAVMGGKAVNGWKFWSLAEASGEQTEKSMAKGSSRARTKGNAAKGKKLIYKVPNPHNIAQGKQKFFCTACMKGFIADEGTEPQVCPAGHRFDDPELMAPADAEALDA